jgi:hypothetical protein
MERSRTYIKVLACSTRVRLLDLSFAKQTPRRCFFNKHSVVLSLIRVSGRFECHVSLRPRSVCAVSRIVRAGRALEKLLLMCFVQTRECLHFLAMMRF